MSAYSTLLAALVRATRGQTWCVDNWRDEAELAQLTSAEKGAAHEHAVTDGYLIPLGEWHGKVFDAFTRVTSHAPGKSRRVVLYARTAKPLPGQPVHEQHRERAGCEGQADLLEMVGGGS